MKTFQMQASQCVGQELVPLYLLPLTEYLLSVYDWKGAMTVIAGLVLQGAVAGALFKPIKKCKHP